MQEEISAVSERLDYEHCRLRNTDGGIEPFLTGIHAEQKFMDSAGFFDYIVRWQSILRQPTE